MTSFQSRQSMPRVGAVYQQPRLDNSNEPPSPQEANQAQDTTVVDLTADDEPEKYEEEQDAPEETAKAQTEQDGRRVRRTRRNRPLDATHRSEQGFEVIGEKYSVGQFVELIEPEADYDIQFINIKSVYVHKETAEVVVRGLPYARNRHVVGRLPRKQNEVCLILEIDDDDERPEEDQALITIAPEQILRTRTLINTNKSFPACRFDEVVYPTKTARDEQAPLTCRWRMRVNYQDHHHRTIGRWNAGAILHMTEHDHGIKRRNLGLDEQRSRAWREDASPGILVSNTHDAVDTDGQGLRDTQLDQTYSFADILCGSGGVSRGAEMAGLKVVAAVDPWSVACDTYTANFPHTRLYEMEVTEFVQDIDHPHVDILHISLNLQHREKDDETNVAAISAFGKLLGKLRPRVLTMDQNPVLGSDANTALFGSLIQACTSHGFSAQWRIIHLVEYGLPQLTRKRLFIIGAAPGERLPPWPAATHSCEPEGDQQPYMTVNEAIRDLDPDINTLHDTASVRRLRRIPRPEYADDPLNGSISISGDLFVHPSGHREFTLRELASLHGFPTEHHFEGAYIKKQIGNAFPPSVARVIFQHLKQWLKSLDGAGPHSSSASKSESHYTDVMQIGGEARVQKWSTGQNWDEGRDGPHNSGSIRRGCTGEYASLQPSSASSSPTIAIPWLLLRSISQYTPTRQTSSQTPESPQTPSSSRTSDLYPDSLVPDISPSVASTTGPYTPDTASSHPALTYRKRRHISYSSLEGDDAEESTTGMLETPSKRARYSAPLPRCH